MQLASMARTRRNSLVLAATIVFATTAQLLAIGEADAQQVHKPETSTTDSNASRIVSNRATTPEADVRIGRELSFNDNRRMVEMSRAKGKDKESLMSRILPMLAMPFLISSALIPMMLTSLKFMLLKSLFVGKIAILLLALNALWKSENRGGVYSHNINISPDQKDLHMKHYGYNGDEEYGAYVNGRAGRQHPIS